MIYRSLGLIGFVLVIGLIVCWAEMRVRPSCHVCSDAALQCVRGGVNRYPLCKHVEARLCLASQTCEEAECEDISDQYEDPVWECPEGTTGEYEPHGACDYCHVGSSPSGEYNFCGTSQQITCYKEIGCLTGQGSDCTIALSGQGYCKKDTTPEAYYREDKVTEIPGSDKNCFDPGS